MNKKYVQECEPIQSIKVLDININNLKSELLGTDIDPEIRKEKENQIALMMASRNDLQVKHDKTMQAKNNRKSYPQLRSNSKGYTTEEYNEIIRLIDSV